MTHGKWRARYRDDAGKEHARHFGRQVDAKRWLDEVTAARLTGQYVDPRAGEITFREYAETWRKIQTHKPSTAEIVERHLRLHVYPVIGSLPLRAIMPSHLQAMVSGWSVTPATGQVIWRFVGTIFKSAVRDRKIAVSPCVGVKPRPVPARQIEVISTELVLAITDAMPERYRAMVTLSAGTGMRQGEVFGLTRDRIRLEQKEVRVDQQIRRLAGEKPILAPTKTESSDRTIPLPKVVSSALAAHLLQFPSDHPDGLVFTNVAGGALYRSGFNQVWQRAVRKAGGDRVGFHALRHFYASLLISHGESVTVVQDRLGHKSAEETLRTYSHLWPDSGERTRAAVDDVLGSRADSLRTADSIEGL